MVGCTKLFHAAEFVHKHLRLKHLDLVMNLTSKVREELYFYNYMNDTDAPDGQPVMEQPLPRDMPQRSRMDNQRLRDDCGNYHRKDQERVDRKGGGGGDDERFDKTENSPSRDVQSNRIGGGGDPDELMYDTYGGAGGSGLYGAQFLSDLAPPPPVLMPVTGAGRLGPFVHAPPKVAMRMLREQGGNPFEGTVARNGRVRPQVIGGGPTPIIDVSLAFRPDPRRLRSYQDLDAPEDEVTVIDFRSL
ncbi:serrate RNA effector molecule-like isoform X2 [Papaver somniferum]|nr:serrate RNA effector molecule-like isoform X2 [Papaver somniferum]XP_026396201.1 serrate RNA effector molecule-like isoform X2 [Papaver somniferum]XP_026396205.1 serrate RNA effector molecule-like isoform X2 [Papaver somniferum]